MRSILEQECLTSELYPKRPHKEAWRTFLQGSWGWKRGDTSVMCHDMVPSTLSASHITFQRGKFRRSGGSDLQTRDTEWSTSFTLNLLPEHRSCLKRVTRRRRETRRYCPPARLCPSAFREFLRIWQCSSLTIDTTSEPLWKRPRQGVSVRRGTCKPHTESQGPAGAAQPPTNQLPMRSA